MLECIFCDPFQTLRRNFNELQKKVESLTTSSLESLWGKVRTLSACAIAEFCRFEAIKDAAQDSKHSRANYYKLVCETLHSKIHCTSDGQL